MLPLSRRLDLDGHNFPKWLHLSCVPLSQKASDLLLCINLFALGDPV